MSHVRVFPWCIILVAKSPNDGSFDMFSTAAHVCCDVDGWPFTLHQPIYETADNFTSTIDTITTTISGHLAQRSSNRNLGELTHQYDLLVLLPL